MTEFVSFCGYAASKYCSKMRMTDVLAGGWGAEAANPSGYGKASAPSRGGIANYRTRPY